MWKFREELSNRVHQITESFFKKIVLWSYQLLHQTFILQNSLKEAFQCFITFLIKRWFYTLQHKHWTLYILEALSLLQILKNHLLVELSSLITVNSLEKNICLKVKVFDVLPETDGGHTHFLFLVFSIFLHCDLCSVDVCCLGYDLALLVKNL